ncbi:MAG: hypothetical protein RI922_164 [Bacteroidota bacterium]|jgi:uncharacterized protein (DUF2141 family)
MKVILIVSLFAVLSSSFITPSTISLTVNVNGFSSSEGKAHIAIYRVSDEFPAAKGQYKGQIVEINDKKIASATFSDLPKATYAVAVFHDKNKNGVMDKNLVGVPTEKYGFSNNARETFSAPSFESASVKVEGQKTIWIYVK